MAVLTPEYLSADYNTLVTKLKALIKDDSTFRDTDYEGSNISILIELMAYIAELNTYYINKVAKNTYLDTADQYDTVHALASQIGYYPKGYRSARANLVVTINPLAPNQAKPINPGDNLKIEPWRQVYAKTSDGQINFANPNAYTTVVPSSGVLSFSIPIIQGTVKTYETYKGKDIINNELLLPTLNFANDEDVLDDDHTVELYVNDDLWIRVSDFYDDLSGLTSEDNVYMLVYDKYGRSKLLFNSSRNIPLKNDELTIIILESLGAQGSVGGNTIIYPQENFLYNMTDRQYVDATNTFSITNSASTRSSADPETIEEVRSNAKGSLHAQFRNVTKQDYIAHLEARADVIAASVWGEFEFSPSGSLLEYNKVHLCIFPDQWGDSTIATGTDTWIPSGGTATDTIIVPSAIITSYENTLKEYLEPRKMLTTYEVMEMPELVYFSVKLAVRLKRLYTLADISADVLDKLEQFFLNTNRSFYEIINPMDIIEYILDTTIISESDPTNEFSNIKGIRNLVIRDIDCNKHIYEYNTDWNHPCYTIDDFEDDVENKLRPIQLGYTQFPVLSISTSSVTEES